MLVFLLNGNNAAFKIKGFKALFRGGQLVAQGQNFFGLLGGFFKCFHFFLLHFFNLAVQGAVHGFKLGGLLAQAKKDSFPLLLVHALRLRVVVIHRRVRGIFKGRRKGIKGTLYRRLLIGPVLLCAGQIFHAGF